MSVEYMHPRFGIDAGFRLPTRWAFDGDLKRKAPVLDADNGNRVVRFVGFRRCLVCSTVMWTEDVARIRICDDCKQSRWE